MHEVEWMMEYPPVIKDKNDLQITKQLALICIARGLCRFLINQFAVSYGYSMINNHKAHCTKTHHIFHIITFILYFYSLQISFIIFIYQFLIDHWSQNHVLMSQTQEIQAMISSIESCNFRWVTRFVCFICFIFLYQCPQFALFIKVF